MNSIPLQSTSFGAVAGDITDTFLKDDDFDFDLGWDRHVTPTPPSSQSDAPAAPSSFLLELQQRQNELLGQGKAKAAAATAAAAAASNGDANPDDATALARLMARYDNDLDRVQEHLTRETQRLQREQEASNPQQQDKAIYMPQAITSLPEQHPNEHANTFSAPSTVQSTDRKKNIPVTSFNSGLQQGVENKDGAFDNNLLSLPTRPTLPNNVSSSNGQSLLGFSKAGTMTMTVPPVPSTSTLTDSRILSSKRPRASSSFKSEEDKLQDILRTHTHSRGTSVPDEDGFHPIHLACRDLPNNARLIGTMLATNPNAARLRVRAPVQQHRPSTMFNGGGKKPSQKKRRAGGAGAALGLATTSSTSLDGSYPLHVALTSSAPYDVIKLLLRSHPDALVLGDGTGSVPLSVALRHGAPLPILNLLLTSNPSAAAMPDFRSNTPLHHACAGARSHGSSRLGTCPLSFLRDLVNANPAACHVRNIHGKTPLDLAQSAGGSVFDDEAISFLQDSTVREEEVMEAPDA